MHAIILERNKLVGRKVARAFAARGATAAMIEEPAQLREALGGARGPAVVCGDVFDGDAIAEVVRSSAGARGVLWTAEPLKRALKYLAEAPGIAHVLARKDFDSAPRAAELLHTLARLEDAGVPDARAYVSWGAGATELAVATSEARDHACGTVAAFASSLGAPKRVGELCSELAHELLMNAMYDAPVDAHGRARFAHDRKVAVSLAPHEAAALRIATDGSLLALQVRDPFGRLERRHVLDGLARGFAGGEIDTSGGGAGLGFFVCHNAASALFFDVERGRSTTVTALVDLDLNLRELRTAARSLHFWSR